MKKAIIWMLILCMLFSLCGCDPSTYGKQSPNTESSAANQTNAMDQDLDKVEGSGYASPEEAILAYAQALKQADVDEIIATFAIETYVEHFDLTAYIENTGVYSYGISQPIPSADAYTAELNRVARQYQISKNLTNMYMSMGKVENFFTPITFNGDPYGKPSELVDDLVIYNWMDMLSKLEIGQVLTVDDLALDSEGLSKTLENQKKYLCCDELVPLAVELTMDGEDYFLCVDLACYDGIWYNCNPMGMLGMLMDADVLSGGLVSLEE